MSIVIAGRTKLVKSDSVTKHRGCEIADFVNQCITFDHILAISGCFSFTFMRCVFDPDVVIAEADKTVLTECLNFPFFSGCGTVEIVLSDSAELFLSRTGVETFIIKNSSHHNIDVLVFDEERTILPNKSIRFQ